MVQDRDILKADQ